MPSIPSQTNKITTPFALAAALLVSNAALGDVTQGGDWSSFGGGFAFGITGSGWMDLTQGATWLNGSSVSFTLGVQPGSNGRITLSGTDPKNQNARQNARLKSVGHGGFGLLEVFNGHKFNSIYQGELLNTKVGSEPSGVGIIHIDGVGSNYRSTNQKTIVGGYGTGTMRIDGGVYEGDSITLGKELGSFGELIVSGGAGECNITGGGIIVGRHSSPDPTGLLRVINGGTCDLRFLSSSDTVIVGGTGSTITTSFEIGISSESMENTLTHFYIQNGGYVETTTTFNVQSDNNGTNTQSLSELNIHGDNSSLLVKGSALFISAYSPSIAQAIVQDGGFISTLGKIRIDGNSSLIGFQGRAEVDGNLEMSSIISANSFPHISFTAATPGEIFIDLHGDLELATGAYLVLPHNDDLTLARGDRFMIIALGGDRVPIGAGNPNNEFANFVEGDIVDTYNGIDLYITYQGGDGNDIELYTLVTEPCPADLTDDGTLNFFDVSAFLIAFNTNDPIADFTNDGKFNFFDVSAFLLAFSAGCP